MPSYSIHDIVLARYPFSDLSSSKVRPAVVVSTPHPSHDVLIVPLTSRTQRLMPGEFVLADWEQCGLIVASAVKRGVFTIDSSIVIKRIGALSSEDANTLIMSLRLWLGI